MRILKDEGIKLYLVVYLSGEKYEEIINVISTY